MMLGGQVLIVNEGCTMNKSEILSGFIYVILIVLFTIGAIAAKAQDIIISDMQFGPVPVGDDGSVTVTPTGEVELLNGVSPTAAIFGNGDNITVNNEGTVKTTNGDNAPAIFVMGDNAVVDSSGFLEMTGNNSAGISIIGDGFNVMSTGPITSGLTDNNEGVSIVGSNGTVFCSSPFTSTGSNSEAISVDGTNIYVESTNTIVTEGFQSEGISLSGDDNTLIRSDSITTYECRIRRHII